MRPEGVSAAQRELKRALRARNRFVSSTDIEEIEDAYDAFLTHAARIHEKLRAACYGHPLDWSWWKKKMDHRRDDPVQLYIHKARNAGTHRLEDFIEWTGRVRGITSLESLRPLPVMDREGNIYHPPGNMLANDLVWKATVYLASLVDEAASRLR